MATKAALTSHPVPVPGKGLILEVGCGRGRCNEFLSISADRIVQLDSSCKMLALKDRESCLLQVYADATSVPLFDEQFTAVVGFLIDPFIGLGFFTEALRLLVPNGLLLATTPAAEWGLSLRGNKEPEVSSARFLTKSLSEKSLCRIPVAEWPIDIGGLKALEHQVHRTYPYHRLA